MTLNSRDFGFWRVVKSFGIGQMVRAWDFVTAAVLASGGTYLYVLNVEEPAGHVALAGDYLVVASALFGVLIAGFASPQLYWASAIPECSRMPPRPHSTS